MLDIVDDYNLMQMVHEPTRLENTLDLVFTTHPDLIENTYTVFVYKKADMESHKQDLEHSFNTLLASDPATKTVEENWADFKTTLISTSKKHIPQKTIAGKKSLPWLNTRIKRLIRQKQRRYNTARRTKSDHD